MIWNFAGLFSSVDKNFLLKYWVQSPFHFVFYFIFLLFCRNSSVCFIFVSFSLKFEYRHQMKYIFLFLPFEYCLGILFKFIQRIEWSKASKRQKNLFIRWKKMKNLKKLCLGVVESISRYAQHFTQQCGNAWVQHPFSAPLLLTRPNFCRHLCLRWIFFSAFVNFPFRQGYCSRTSVVAFSTLRHSLIKFFWYVVSISLLK